MKRLACVLLLMSIGTLAAQSADEAMQLPPYQRAQLKNGVTVLLMEQHEVPLVSISFLVRAGSAADPQGKEGVASTVAGLLRKGTKTRTAEQIANELDFIGATLSADATYEYTAGSAEFMAKDVEQALTLVADVLTNPVFPQGEFSKLIKQSIDGVRAAKDDPADVIGLYYRAYLYGKHPYGRPSGGTEVSLPSITLADVRSYYATHFTPSNTILAVAGDFESAEMQALLERKFGGWPDKKAPKVEIPAVESQTGRRLLLVDKPDATQTYYRIGNIGIDRKNEDRAYVDVVNTLFGGRFTSMLNSALRIKSGLTYGASARFDERLQRGPFFISSFTRNATTEQALDMTLDILKQLHGTGVSDEDLKSAKSYIRGQFPPTLETANQLAGYMTEVEFFGLPKDELTQYFRKLDGMDTAAAARIIRQYYPREDLVFTLVGKSSEIGKVAAKYAPKVENKSITQPGF